MRRALLGLSVLSVLAIAGSAGAAVPPEFTRVSSDAGEIDFEKAVVAINCGDATYQVRDVTFWAYRSSDLDAYCDRAFNNITGPSWNGAWPNPFTDPELDFLDEVYKSISYWDQPMWLEFKGLVSSELYKIQFLFTANQQNTWDHGGSVKVIGAEETEVFSDVHLNTFARGVPYVVTAEDIEPSADGVIRVEYFHDVDWVPSPALDNNKIWSAIILTGASPIKFPTDLAVRSDGQKATLSWVNHEPSTSGTPYDQIEIVADDKVRGILGEGPAVIDEAKDNTFVIDLTLPANADLRTGGMHRIGIRTSAGTSTSQLLKSLGVPPIGIAVGDYGAGFTELETSDGRVWFSDAGIVQSDQRENWMGNVPFDGIPNLEEFGLDPLDPADQSLFAIFRWEDAGGLDSHMRIRLPIADGKYDIRFYFWEFDSPWIRNRTGQVSIEGGPRTFFAYGDDLGEFAPLASASEAWSILFESAEVKDGLLDVDFLAGWRGDRNVTLAAFEVLPADPEPKGPKNFRATRTGAGMYDLAWDLPAGADFDAINILSRISGQNESLDGAATSFLFEQEITFETTDNEGFALQARKGNTFYAQLHAGAGAAPMFINAGGAGNVNGGVYVETPVDARGEVWVSDLPYVDRRRSFVPPLVSGDLNYVQWGNAFRVIPGTPAEDLDPPFDNPDNLMGGELQLLQQIRWCEGPPANDPMQLMTWQIPISKPDKDGYLVRLYFGEGCCVRANDVVVEGSEPQRIYYNGLAGGDTYPDDRDYVETTMGGVGIMEFGGVQVDDGFVTVDFLNFCPFGQPYDNNATISAIEILGGVPPIGFIRGDADGNGQYTIGDGIQILNLQFDPAVTKMGSDCDDTGDLDDNGVFTIGDAVYLFNFLFAGGPAPVGQPLTPGRLPESCMKDTTPSASMRPCNYPSEAACP